MEVLHSYSNKARHYLYHLDQIVEAAQALPKTPKPRKRAAKSSTKLIHRLSTHQVAVMTDRYKQGWSSQRIAETYSISKTSVVQLLREAGVTIRRQGLTAEQAREAARLYKDGQSLAWIGQRFVVSPGCVRNSLVAQGVKMR
ncbi:hypothetical protein [Sinomonas sp. P10A9]|uniref:Uncharacterized protein n=1 Tax=Sinomonas puerhi TaxID=3238584 RepID=A0AB39KYU0_9MICC